MTAAEQRAIEERTLLRALGRAVLAWMDKRGTLHAVELTGAALQAWQDDPTGWTRRAREAAPPRKLRVAGGRAAR